MTTTRLGVIQRMADAMNLRLSGTLSSAVAAASTTVQDATARHEQDDYLNEGFFLATSSGSVVEEHRISDFANASQTMSLYGAGLSTSLSSGLAYDVFLRPVTPDQYRKALKAAASKLAALGITRRALDTTTVTNLDRKYAMPSTIDVSLASVWIQAAEYIANNIWKSDDSAWTLHASASLTNDGAVGERTLKLVATAANEHSYVEVDVSSGSRLEFFAKVKSDGANSARWQYRIVDQDGTVIVAYTTIGSAVTAAAWTEVNGTILVPANGVRIRIAFNSSAAATVYTQGPQLMRYGDWARLSNIAVEYDGETSYFVLPATPPEGRRLKLIGRRTLESLSADTDTISMDEPEIAALIELACAEAWRQYGPHLGLDQGMIQFQIALHETEYRKIAGRLSSEWSMARRVIYPRFTASH